MVETIVSFNVIIYEVISRQKYKLTSKEDITPEIMDTCFSILLDEIKTFENKYWKLKTICSHGDKVNRIIKVSNYKIIDKAKLISIGISFNTYDPLIMNKFDAHISDNSIHNDFEWKHFHSPEKAFIDGKKTICLLTHPIHWNQNYIKNSQMLFNVYADNINKGF